MRLRDYLLWPGKGGCWTLLYLGIEQEARATWIGFAVLGFGGAICIRVR